MSRMILALAIFVAVLLVIFIPLGLLESRRTPDWQAELSRYLITSGVPARDIQHVEVAEAQRPEQFAADLLQAVPTSWTWSGIDRIPRPEWVQCIRIERQRPAGRGTTPPVRSGYLLVGYHHDGQWRAGWLVHEFRGDVSEEEQQGLLDQLGCKDWVELSARLLYHSSIGNFPHVAPTPNASEIYATYTALAPTPTLGATALPTPTAVPTNRSGPTAEPTPRERYVPPFIAPLPREWVVSRGG